MGKRPATSQPGTPARGRKKGRGRKKDNDNDMPEDEELAAQQLRRQQIIQGNDDEDEMLEFQEEGGQMLEDIYIPPKITRAEHPCTGERLVIEKIVCENFKSYGGLKEMGPFHKSFSAIIGPNGNGKSNIIDAMLFVFGYRASKIRCKKVSTLIHKSELLPNLRDCAVTVHFVKIIDEGDADPIIVENSRITVMRRASANNSSKYYLDGKSVTFQEVAKFLKANGIDIVHNRFLILQGEVEQIAQMPPIGTPNGDTGLLEFLEEVIGTKRYIKPLAQLDERVEKLDYERDEKLQRVNVAETDKEKLAGPVEKAKDYLRNQNSRMKYQSFLYQKQAQQVKAKMAEKEAARVKIEENLHVVQEKLKEILEKSNARKKEFQDAEKDFKISEKDYAKVKKKFDAADAEFIQLTQELQRTNESRKKLQKEFTKLEADIEKLSLIPEGNKKDIETFTKRKLELESDISKEEAAIKGSLEKLNIKVESALQVKEAADKEFAKFRSIKDAKKSTLDKLQKELNNYKERESVEKKKLEELETELSKLKESIQKKEREGRGSVGGANRIESMEKKHHELQGQIRQLSAKEQEKRNICENARGEYQQAQESSDGNSQLDKVDRALLEAKADGMFPGLYGRMKNLAKIPDKYNIAATMSTGMLEYWITDDDNTAGNCIRYLREKDLPTQTFMCISKIQNYTRQAKERFDTPAQSHRIFDLLQISAPELVPAYFKAYRNTLVCDNIDIATKVSFGGSRRHRVATLAGEIVEATGSMSGGGRSRPEGKFNSKKSGVSVTRQQLAALNERYQTTMKHYQEAQEAKQACDEKARTILEQIQEEKRKIINFNSDMSALQAQLPLKAANVETQRKKVQDSTIAPNVLKAKENAVAKAEEEYETSLEPFTDAEANIAQLAESLEELQVGKKKEITKKLDKMKDQLKKTDDELNRKIVELKNCEANRKKSEKKMETIQKEIETLKSTMEKKNERRKKVEEDAKGIKDSEAELSKIAEEAKKKYEALKTHAHEFQKEENSLSKEKLSLENKHSDAASSVRGCQNSLKQLMDSLNALELNDIPEEEVEALRELTEDEVESIAMNEIERKLKKYDDRIGKMPIPNLNVLEEYKLRVNQLFQRLKELEDITKQRDMFRDAYCRLDQQRSTEFMEGFALISSRLKEMFRMISMGGDAELEVVDILDLFGCGIQFSVRPARKTWKKISNLSGGEKTLASLSLVFALHHFKPSPFYVMDEIDAALDFKNVSIIANYIKDRTKFTQFIIISLRSNMFELADSLLGVYKVDNMSYSIHLSVKKLIKDLKSKYHTHTNTAPIASQGGNTALLASQGGSQQTQVPDSQKTKSKPGFADLSMIPSDSETDPSNATVISNRANLPDSMEDHTILNELIASQDKSRPSPVTQSSRKSIPAVSSPDMFEDEDMDLDMEHEDNLNGGARNIPRLSNGSGPIPIAASTPFVGKRLSNHARPQLDDESMVDDPNMSENEMEISPIKQVETTGVRPILAKTNVAEGNADDEDDNFQTAEENSDDDVGPSVSQRL